MQRRDALKGLMLMSGMGFSMTVARALASGVSDPVANGLFTDAQRRLVAAMADRIIPPTDTPGAVQTGAVDFIENIVFRWYTDAEREVFLTGLADTEALAQQRSHGFAALPASDQDAILAELEQRALAARQGQAGFALMPSLDEDLSPFFMKLKELVVVGYYTSQIGATQELRYEPMAMQYAGDVPLADVGRAWADGGF